MMNTVHTLLAGLFWLATLPLLVAAPSDAVYSYIDQYKDIAIHEMHDHGIPASIKLAQAILESNAGRSHLAIHGNNHFGIKCGKYWSGPTVMREDDDYVKGKLIKSCFRAYPEVATSFQAHSDFLLDPKKKFRYGFLFDLHPKDYRAWAKGLKKAGYATNPKYPEKLISLIELYGLDAYDYMPRPAGIEDDFIVMRTAHPAEDDAVHPAESTDIAEAEPTVEETTKEEPQLAIPKAKQDFSYAIAYENGVPYVLSHGGDRLTDIASDSGTDMDHIIRGNEYVYGRTQELDRGTRIYLAKKKKKYRGRRNYHRMAKNETLFDVAQRYGIDEKALRKRNRWTTTYQPKTGERVYLKKRRPKA